MEPRLGKERAYEKFAWVIPRGLGIFFFVRAIATLISPVILTGAEDMVQSMAAEEHREDREQSDHKT